MLNGLFQQFDWAFSGLLELYEIDLSAFAESNQSEGMDSKEGFFKDTVEYLTEWIRLARGSRMSKNRKCFAEIQASENKNVNVIINN